LIFLVFLVLPFAGAADPVPGFGGQGVAGTEFNGTGTDIANSTLPSRYAVTPAPIDVRVEVSAASLPGPKGEMAAGPRSIGFAADPGSLVIAILGVMAVTAGFLYLKRRRADQGGKLDPEEPEE
jgi:hypothetical protein